MRRDEAQDLAVLAGLAVGGGVQRIAQAHAGVAERVFSSVGLGVGPAVTPVRLVHDAASKAAYGAVQTGLAAGARALVRAASSAASSSNPDGTSLADVPGARIALGVINGAHGDVLRERATTLALPMRLRLDGADLDVNPEKLRTAYPGATDRLVVFLHGLVETEDAWHYRAEHHHGDRRTTYGALLERHLGYTPMWVR